MQAVGCDDRTAVTRRQRRLHAAPGSAGMQQRQQRRTCADDAMPRAATVMPGIAVNNAFLVRRPELTLSSRRLLPARTNTSGL